jgi:phenylpyruvate tautomerase PptA (4-oxalocrotonate tautomerase family)
MPIMRVYHREDALDAVAKAKLAQRLTDVLITMEGTANTKGGRAFAWVLFTPGKAGAWWIGGQRDERFVHAPGRFLVHVTVPEGYMSALHPSELHALVNAAIITVTGGDGEPDAGASSLVIIDEATEGDWGASGRTISLNAITETVGLRRDSDRFAWIQSYFAAKRRQFEAAGYPADVGGLPPASVQSVM